MKKSIMFFFLASIVMTGIMISGCGGNDTKKEEAAKEQVVDAQKNLKEVQQEADTKARMDVKTAEWVAFKKENEMTIADNETKIAELKVKMKKPGKSVDNVYEKKIENLEIKNAELKMKIANYQMTDSNWDSFKSEVNHDMNQLGQAFKDLAVDNKK